MKNLFNINFKSIVQRKARWLLTILAILTLGVGQMWGETVLFYKDGANMTDAYAYFYSGTYWDNNNGAGSNGITSQCNHMTSLGGSGTNKIYVYQINSDHTMVAIMKHSQSSYGNFDNTCGCANTYSDCPDGYYSITSPMLISNGSSSFTKQNGRVTYYHFTWGTPTLWLQHPFDSETWSWKEMTYNGDGTFYLNAYHRNGNGCDYGQNNSKADYISSFNKTPSGDWSHKAKYVISFTGGTVNLSVTKLCAVSFNMNGHGSAIDSKDVLYNTTTSAPSNPSATGWTFGGWYTDAECTSSFSFSTAITDDLPLYAKWTENKTNITITAGEGGSIITPDPNNSPYSLGVVTKQAIVAEPYVGYRFNTWTLSGNGAVDNASSASTNAKTNGASSGTGTVTATFARIYAFIEGRFHVTNSSRNGSWTNTFDGGNWAASSTNIAFEYDGTNHRFYRHTYATPKELTDQISSENPVFYVKTSTASGSITGETNYKAPSPDTYLNTAGTKVALSDHSEGNTHDANLRFNSSDESGYVILYFDQSDIWYQLEQTLSYNGNGNTSGSNPSTVYYLKGTTTTTAADNVYSKTGYAFSGWNEAANGSGAGHAASSSITMNSNITLYAQWSPNVCTLTFNKNTGAWSDASGDATKTRKIVYDAAYNATYNPGSGAQGAIPALAIKNGYRFDGWFTESSGGTKIINPDGSWVSSVAGYTDASAHWIHVGDQTLYAQYTLPTITGITFSPTKAMPLGTVKVTPTLSAEPEGTFSFCYKLKLGYSPYSVMTDQPDYEPTGESTGEVTFAAPGAAHDYTMDVYLYAGEHNCGDVSGLIASYTSNSPTFEVEAANAVTVLYKCGSAEIRSSSTVYATATNNTATVTAPNIPGFTFSGWTRGANVTRAEGANDNVNPIVINASAASTLTANYDQGPLFFKDTKGWGSVYIYFYNHATNYWHTRANDTESEGTGSKRDNSYFISGPHAMTLLEGSDDVYYYNGDIPGAAVAYAFTDIPMGDMTKDKSVAPGYDYFAGTKSLPCNVVYVNHALNSNKPMIVPVGNGNLRNNNMAYYYAHDLASIVPDWGYDLRGDDIGWSPATEADKHKMKAPKLGDLSFSSQVYYDNVYDYKEWKIYNGNTGYGRSDHQKITKSNNTSSALANINEGGNMRIQTNIAGYYTFTQTFGTASTDGTFSGAKVSDANGLMGHMTVTVTYPVKVGDFRLIYTGTHPHPGDVVKKRANAKDTVNMFVPKGEQAKIKVQACTAVADGSVTWTAVASCTALNYAAGVSFTASDSAVYNFIIEQDAEMVAKVTKVEKYTGHFYVRTNCITKKWNYKEDKDAHVMTHSEYSTTLKENPYSHYYIKDLHGGTGASAINIRFTVATDYSEAICDTVINSAVTGAPSDTYGNESLTRTMNVRFTYDQARNILWRAYTEGPENDDYMVLHGKNKLYASAGAADPTNSYKFKDMGNWVYQVDVYATAIAYVKLTAEIHNSEGTETTQYIKGNNSNDDYDEDDAVILLGGEGVKQHMRVTYDFKTDRMITSWIPENEVAGNTIINADVMLIRKHQEGAKQITFASGDDNKLTSVKTIYGVMQFDSTYINDDSRSRYSRSLYWISFPFEVQLSEVFGFGTYGKHWIIEYYDGYNRAQKGYWSDSDPNWKYVTPAMRDTFKLKANEGYVLALSLNRMADGCTDVWPKDVNTTYLYFPSTTELGTIANVASKDVTIKQTGYQCTINRADGTEGDRRIKDSYWHCIGVPSFANNSITTGTAEPVNWEANIPYVYEWNSTTNALAVNTNASFEFKAMHSYLVQYNGTTLTWTNVSNKSSIVARRKVEGRDAAFYEWNLNLLRGDEQQDHTYVRLTNDENVTENFDFGQDLSKEMNSGTNIYTIIGYERAAGNCLPMNTTSTTIVPVGVKIATAGEYTFALPEGSEGVGIILIDNVTGTHTNLALTNYTVTLNAGQIDGRFSLEISPIHNAPTSIDNVQGDNVQSTKARKVMIDNVLYIVKDGKVFDATGQRVE